MIVKKQMAIGWFLSWVIVPMFVSDSEMGVLAQEKSAAIKPLLTRSAGLDWPQFLGPHGNGQSDETGILRDWAEGKLKPLWSKEIGDGYGMGSVADGRFFQFDRHQGKARVRCFQSETGADLWSYEYESNYSDLYGYDNGPRASPVVDGNRVYVFGVEGKLTCLSADQGAEIWSLDTTEAFGVIQNFFGVSSSPVIFEDLLLLMVGGSPEESQRVPPGALDRVKSNGSGIVALDKMTGKVRYEAIDDLASYSTIQLTQFGGRTIALALMREALIGFDPKTGRQLFETPYRSKKLESVNASTPVVDGDFIFVSECYELGSALLKLSENGKEVEAVWEDQGKRNKSLEAHWNTPVLVDGYLYGCSGRHPGSAELRCVEWETGKVNWSQVGFGRCSVLAIDGHLVLLGEQGQLVLLKANPEKFELVTQFDGSTGIEFKPPCWSAPIVSRGLLYVRGKDQLVCFELIPAESGN